MLLTLGAGRCRSGVKVERRIDGAEMGGIVQGLVAIMMRRLTVALWEGQVGALKDEFVEVDIGDLEIRIGGLVGHREGIKDSRKEK